MHITCILKLYKIGDISRIKSLYNPVIIGLLIKNLRGLSTRGKLELNYILRGWYFCYRVTTNPCHIRLVDILRFDIFRKGCVLPRVGRYYHYKWLIYKYKIAHTSDISNISVQ